MTMNRLMINEDCTNFFFYHNLKPGKSGEILDRYIDTIAGTGPGILLINTNARRTNYQSQVWETFWDGYDPHGPDSQPALASVPAGDRAKWRMLIGNMQILSRDGIDYPARAIERCRGSGSSPWISLRMNDVHYNDIPSHPFHGTFWTRNPQFKRQGTDGYFADALDYAHPEVRDYYMRLIQETLARYDVDGLELDFLREPYLFSAGKEPEGRRILTDWLGEIRELVTATAAERHHPIQLGIRVPSVMATAVALGMDVPAWLARGFPDILVVTPRWATTEFDLPLAEWRRILQGTKTQLAGGLEVRYQPMPDGPASLMTPELAIGLAASVLHDGGDFVYLFNYFQDGHPGWSRSVYQATLRAMTSLATLQALPRHHAITYRDIIGPNESYRPPLPVTGKELSWTMATGPTPPADWVCELVIETSAAADDSGAKLKVTVEDAGCSFLRVKETGEGKRVVEFAVPTAALRGTGHSVISIRSTTGQELTVTRVEMHFHPLQ